MTILERLLFVAVLVMAWSGALLLAGFALTLALTLLGVIEPDWLYGRRVTVITQ